MSKFSVLQVCEAGHIITDRYETGEVNENYCAKCGKVTITECPKCQTPIRGATYEVSSINYKTGRTEYTPGETDTPPNYCHSCNYKFPWAPPSTQSSSTQNLSQIDNILKLFSRFHLFTKPLTERKHHRDIFKIENEYDVQDLIHAILKLQFDDVRPEEYTPSYAGSSARVDFLIKEIQLVIEIKKTRDSLKDKEIGEQLTLDITKYAAHPDCENLICFVYDPDEKITNYASLEKDLSGEKNGINVKTLIVPKGT